MKKFNYLNVVYFMFQHQNTLSYSCFTYTNLHAHGFYVEVVNNQGW